jgi:hypothetical protein
MEMDGYRKQQGITVTTSMVQDVDTGRDMSKDPARRRVIICYRSHAI